MAVHIDVGYPVGYLLFGLCPLYLKQITVGIVTQVRKVKAAEDTVPEDIIGL